MSKKCFITNSIYFIKISFGKVLKQQKKHLISPQWLRNIKGKKYPLWRIDTFFSSKNIQNLIYIKNGGWHFTCLRTAEKIRF